MCGIAGSVSLTGRPVQGPERVRSMMQQLVHRGPDEEGLYESPSGRAVLGHRRLRIIDLATGRQPLTNEDGRVVVAFNGEIYGFQSLRDELMRAGHRLHTTSDTEVIVHLYEDAGLSCLDRLRGMFALALWDERSQQLLLARDRMGKKPLYYTIERGELLFASELHALSVASACRTEIDESALDCYLTFGYIPAPHTIYQSVQKLEAGQYLLVHNGTVRTARYWSLAPASDGPSLPYDEAKDELVARLRRATADRMISDVPIGCFLSGGIDSSVVLAMMAELSPQPVRTFSIGFPEQEYSELPYARAVARHFGTDHHEYVLEPDAVEVLDKLVRHFGEPFADSSALATWYLSEMTRKSVVVALTGDGGDELFGGYGWYRTGRLLGQLAWIPRPVLQGLSACDRPTAPRLLQRLGKTARFLTYPPGLRHAALRQMAPSSVKRDLYRSDVAARIEGRALAWLSSQYESLGGTDELNRMMATDLRTYMAEDLLVKVDRTSMAHALECRSPLLDSDLATWALSLPSAYKIENGIRAAGAARMNPGKRLLREAMQDRLPVGAFDRPKQGFTVPITRWFKGGLRPLITERVLNGPLQQWDCFDHQRIATLVAEHEGGRRDHAALLWALLVLGTWAEQNGMARR